MPTPYCLPIIQQNPDEVLKIVHANLDDYSYFEIWLDYINGVEQTFIKELVELLGRRLIILFRRQNLEPVTMPTEQHQAILNMLSNTAVLVDLDIVTQRAELDYARNQVSGINLITSYHNYEQTPDIGQLEAIIVTMSEYRPAIYKVATFCQTPEDGLRLMQLLLKLRARELAVIVLGMGEHGRITRVCGSLWGNAMSFAPRSIREQSAPGQMSREQLETILKELET